METSIPREWHRASRRSELDIFRLVDQTHATTAKVFDNAVVRDAFADHSGDAQLSGRFILRTRHPLVNDAAGMVTWNPEHLALEPNPSLESMNAGRSTQRE